MAPSFPGVSCAGTPHLKITVGLRAFYAARGMWMGGEPKGWLSTVLGPRVAPTEDWFYASAAQIGELMRDVIENGPRGMNGHQRAQTLRRLRDALKTAGEAVPTVAVEVAQSPQPVARPGNPFMPLAIPPSGRARAAFEKHCFDCLREIVDFQQTSAYGA